MTCLTVPRCVTGRRVVATAVDTLNSTRSHSRTIITITSKTRYYYYYYYIRIITITVIMIIIIHAFLPAITTSIGVRIEHLEFVRSKRPTLCHGVGKKFSDSERINRSIGFTIIFIYFRFKFFFGFEYTFSNYKLCSKVMSGNFMNQKLNGNGTLKF